MEGIVTIFGKEFEYDFLSAWIKYNRLEKNYSQEALAHGICSTSHLCYFEKGERKLREDIIESLLEKLDVEINPNDHTIGHIRKYFYNLQMQIELDNKDEAKSIYKELLVHKPLIEKSPYNIEFKIYQLFYLTFVEKLPYSELKTLIDTADKIKDNLSKELKYLYLFISGKLLYKHKNREAGIARLLAAHKLNDTAWINYHLGYAFCFHKEPLKGSYYLHKSLEAYQSRGFLINTLWCHNLLGVCYSYLKLYEKSEEHLKSALNGAQYFELHNLNSHIYINLSHLYISIGDYVEGAKWSKKSLTGSAPLLSASNYATACYLLGDYETCANIFEKYLKPEYSDSKYYALLRFSFLQYCHSNDKIFYEETKNVLIPYYEKLDYHEITRLMKLGLISYLEKNFKYKEATKLYKEIL